VATLSVSSPGEPGPNSASLSAAQVGNGQSTNAADRGGSTAPALLTIVTTIGATPTCTYAVEGSADGVDWFPVAIADAATPETPSVATFVIATATTTRKVLRPFHPWRYLRLTYSANTNVTNTATLYAF
jgi:hypothetical protein